jgi:glucose-1-phosphate thymidylyltransferase
MKGIILAGGLGTRLQPLTKNDNKHLLPVYKKRMIEYSVEALVNSGIKDIILITGGKNSGQFLELFKNGKDHGVSRIYYTYQEGNAGISDALKLAQPFLESDEESVVLLGDNYFEGSLKKYIDSWNKKGSMMLLKKVNEPWDFGIAEIKNNKVVSIEEKPADPKSDLAIIGAYFFDKAVWNYLKNIKKSKRGEFEITDVLKQYSNDEALTYSIYDDYWLDMGTFSNWVEVSTRVAFREKKQKRN